jgi:general L-amino acid transport system substrate-binding protein
MTFRPLAFEKLEETVQAYPAKRCEAYLADMSSLYSMRVRQAKPGDHVVLPEIISKEPLGPSVRRVTLSGSPSSDGFTLRCSARRNLA